MCRVIWFILNLPTFSRFGISSRLRNFEFEGKLNMNHISLHINRREIWRWFRIWSPNFIFAYAFKRKTRFKKFAWADSKNFYCTEFKIKFWFEIYPYITYSRITGSRITNILSYLKQLPWLLRSEKFYDPENSFFAECVGKNKILTSNSKSA